MKRPRNTVYLSIAMSLQEKEAIDAAVPEGSSRNAFLRQVIRDALPEPPVEG